MRRFMLLLAMSIAVAAAQPNCSTMTIRGTYAVSEYGNLMMMQETTPMTLTGGIVGVVSIGFDGAISGAAAVSGLGPVLEYEVQGNVQFTSNCTGKLLLQGRLAGTKVWTLQETDQFVVDPDGKTLVVIQVQLAEQGQPPLYPAMQGTWKQITPVPNAVIWQTTP